MKNPPKGLIPIVIVIVITLIAATVVGAAWYYDQHKDDSHPPFDSPEFSEYDTEETYLACGCGCCGGVNPVEKCLYRSEGDDLEKIKNQDKAERQNPGCALMGCSFPVLYRYCDDDATNENANTNQNSNTSVNGNVPIIKRGDTVTGEFQYYFYADAPWKNYGVYYKDGVLYHYLSATEAEPLDIGVDISLYHVGTTRFGLLLWKKGETKNVYYETFGDEPIPYEAGVRPDFLLLNIEANQLVTLPSVSQWEEGDTTFDRVYRVFPSINENYLMIEIGEYDIHADEFQPGLIESQPVKSRSMVYDIANNIFTTEDPISIFLSIYNTNIGTTNWNTISWDSENDIIAAAPGGEGCGAYSTISFINLKSKTKETVGSTSDSWGGYDYVNETCNPHNGASPSGKWLLLYGKIADGTYAYRLFAPATTSEVLKKVIKNSSIWEGGSANAITWDESRKYPIINKDGEVFVDFNL